MTFEIGDVVSGEAGFTRIVRAKDIVAEHRRGGRVTVRRADGSTIMLDIDAQTSIEGEPVVVMEGPWGELRRDARLAELAADAVPVFEVVTIHHVGPVAGARVGFVGAVMDQVVGDDGGLRDAPSTTPVVRATLVATGDAIAEHVQRSSPASAGWATALVLAMGMVFSLALLLAITSMTIRQAGIVGVACAGILLTLRPRADLPQMWTRSAAFASEADMPWFAFAAFALFGVVALTADTGVLVIWPPAMASLLAAYAVIGTVLGKRLRVVGRVTRAPIGPGDGVRTIEGTLLGANVVARATRRSEYRHRSSTVKDVVAVEPFALVTTDGATISVLPEEIVWGTTHSSTKRLGDKAFEQIDVIEPGARIAACGRLVRDGDRLALRAVGTEPAIVLATEQPLAFARAAVTRRRLDLAVIAVAIAAQVAIWLVLR